MKKGFLTALLVVAIAAISIPAFAEAPTINDLPTIIIGDNGDTASGKALLRYTNALNLLSYIDYDVNGYPLSENKFHVWYATMAGGGSTADIQASNLSAFLDPLTATGMTSLDSGQEPAAGEGDEITSSGFYWLSLMNLTLTGATPSDAYSADVATHGWDTGTAYTDTAEGFDVWTDMYLYACHVPSFPTTPSLISTKSLTVFSVGGDDDRYSGGGVTFAPVIPPTDFTGGTNNWFHFYGGGEFDEPTEYSTGGIGWQVPTGKSAPSGLAYYATWYMSDDGVEAASKIGWSDGSIYRARATLSNTASTALECPGYRMYFTSTLRNHAGDLLVLTAASDGDSVFAPYSGNNAEVILMWEANGSVAGFGSGGILSDFSGVNSSFTDVRDYQIQFSIADTEAGNYGTFMMTNLAIESASSDFPTVAPSLLWGSTDVMGKTAVDFNDATNGWISQATDPFNINLGTASITADQMVMGPGSQTATAAFGGSSGTSGYMALAIDSTTGDEGSKFIAMPTDRVLRMSYQVASSSEAACGNTRWFIQSTPETGIGLRQSFSVANVLEGGTAKPLLDAAGNATPVGVPAASGTTLRVYGYTHTPALSSNPARVIPFCDIYSTNNGGAGWNTFPDETATLTVSQVWLEVLTMN